MTPEEEAIFERAQQMKKDAKQVIAHSQSTRKQLGGSLIEHFKFLLVMGPTELDKEIKSRFEAWDTDKGGSLNREEMQVGRGGCERRQKWRTRRPAASDALRCACKTADARVVLPVLTNNFHSPALLGDSMQWRRWEKSPLTKSSRNSCKRLILTATAPLVSLCRLTFPPARPLAVSASLPAHDQTPRALFQCDKLIACSVFTDLGEFNHMIRNQLGIGHTCTCKFCEKKKQEEEAANAAVMSPSQSLCPAFEHASSVRPRAHATCMLATHQIMACVSATDGRGSGGTTQEEMSASPAQTAIARGFGLVSPRARDGVAAGGG